MSENADKAALIESTFRNGSLTAISVLLGFSLSFLSRWAAVPGPWQPNDLAAVAAIVLGIAVQLGAVAMLLSVASLRLDRYNRAIRLFLLGLTAVAIGVAIAITGDIFGMAGQVLRG